MAVKNLSWRKTLRKQIALLANSLLDLVYPPICLLCRKDLDDGAMCDSCQRELLPIVPPFCDRCGVPVRPDEPVCAGCERGPEPPYEWAQAMGIYTGTLRRAIHLLKYDGKTALAEPLGVLLARSLTTNTPLIKIKDNNRPAFDAVVPVPLHSSRQRERGFNQAEYIARVAAREKGWKLDEHGLKRIRRTATQTKKNRMERALNVKDAFDTPAPLHFDGQSVLLIDDVCTTMATLSECAATLKNAGAMRVSVLALARG